MSYKTCNHVHDNGYFCESAAVKGRDYCCYHLRYRGRLMRMAQARARNQRYLFDLPPLEDMHAVQSSLTQIVEALAADLIDPRRAQLILSALRQAAKNLKDYPLWRASVYVNDHSETYLAHYKNFETEFGLPQDLDIDQRPEVAFPPPEPVAAEAPPDAPVLAGPDPTSSVAFPAYQITPEDVELIELETTQGEAAMLKRAAQQEANARRREQRKKARADYQRYSAAAQLRNLQLAAQQLVAEQLAAAKAKHPSPATGSTQSTPAVGTLASEPADASTKKPPAPADHLSSETAEKAPREANSTA